MATRLNPNLRMLLLLRQLILADKQSSKSEISIKLYINIQQRDSYFRGPVWEVILPNINNWIRLTAMP